MIEKTIQKLVYLPKKHVVYALKQDVNYMFKFEKDGRCCLSQKGERQKMSITLRAANPKRNVQPKDILYILSANKTLTNKIFWALETQRDLFEIKFLAGQYTS